MNQNTNTLALVQKSDHSLGFYNLADGAELTRVPLQQYPHEFALAPDGETLCVSEYGVQSSASTEAGGDTVAVVDVAAREVIGRIPCDGMRRPHGISFDERGALYVLSEGGDHLLVKRDPRAPGGFDSAHATGGTKGHMLAVKRDGSRAFFMNIASHNVTTLDLEHADAAPAVVCSGAHPEGFCFNADESRLFVANRAGADITVVDTESLQPVGSLPARKSPLRMAMDWRGRIVCAHFADDYAVTGIDPATGAEESSMVPPAAAIFVGFDPAKRRVAFSMQDDTTRIFNAETWQCEQVIHARAEPDAAAFI